jgi:hypothetical protein
LNRGDRDRSQENCRSRRKPDQSHHLYSFRHIGIPNTRTRIASRGLSDEGSVKRRCDGLPVDDPEIQEVGRRLRLLPAK